nr:class I SAM-dependent methyltransferase [Rhizobium sp. ACO-34A]
MTVFPNQAALDYDERIEMLVPGYALAFELFACTLTGRIDPQSSILVPGCGTGSEILALARTFPEARFTAVEPSDAMLEKARYRLTEAGIASRVEFINGFLEDTPEQAHTAATVSLVLHFLPDDGAKVGFLENVARRLSPGAPLVLLDPPDKGEDAVLRLWLERRGHTPGAADAICRRMREEWHRITPERLANLLNVAGFTHPETFFKVPGYCGFVAERRRGN